NEIFNLEKDGQETDHGGDAQLRLVIPRRYPACPGLEPATGLQGLLLAHHHGDWNFTHATQEAAFYLRHAGPLVERSAAALTEKIEASLGAADPRTRRPGAIGSCRAVSGGSGRRQQRCRHGPAPVRPASVDEGRSRRSQPVVKRARPGSCDTALHAA